MPISEKLKMFELPIDLKNFFHNYCKKRLTNPSVVLRRLIECCQAIEKNEELIKNYKLLDLPNDLNYSKEKKIANLGFRIPEDLRTWFNQYCKKRRYTPTEIFIKFIIACKYFDEFNINPQIEDIVVTIAVKLHCNLLNNHNYLEFK